MFENLFGTDNIFPRPRDFKTFEEAETKDFVIEEAQFYALRQREDCLKQAATILKKDIMDYCRSSTGMFPYFYSRAYI